MTPLSDSEQSNMVRAQRVVDALNTNEVLLVSVKLCRDSLGDDLLWAATGELRAALTAFADEEPFPWPQRWSSSS